MSDFLNTILAFLIAIPFFIVALWPLWITLAAFKLLEWI